MKQQVGFKIGPKKAEGEASTNFGTGTNKVVKPKNINTPAKIGRRSGTRGA